MLTALLEGQRLLHDSLRSEQESWRASVEQRLGELERAVKVDSAEEVLLRFSPDGRDPDATVTVGGADRAALELTTELAPSMWDGALFLFRRDVEVGGVVTLWAVLVLLLNILLQVTIAVIVLRNLGDPTFFPRIIEDLWCASQPRFAAAWHGVCCFSVLSFPQVRQTQAVGVTGPSSVGFC